MEPRRLVGGVSVQHTELKWVCSEKKLGSSRHNRNHSGTSTGRGNLQNWPYMTLFPLLSWTQLTLDANQMSLENLTRGKPWPVWKLYQDPDLRLMTLLWFFTKAPSVLRTQLYLITVQISKGMCISIDDGNNAVGSIEARLEQGQANLCRHSAQLQALLPCHFSFSKLDSTPRLNTEQT